jgi:hypothetical protein
MILEKPLLEKVSALPQGTGEDAAWGEAPERGGWRRLLFSPVFFAAFPVFCYFFPSDRIKIAEKPIYIV